VETSLTARRIEAVLATDDHADAIAAFYREAWGQEATAQSVLDGRRRAAAANPATPGEAPPIGLVLDGSRVIGHCASIPYRLWVGAAEYPAHWLKGLMVVPEYRNGPIGFLAVKALTVRLPLTTAVVVAPAARRLFGALGYAALGAVTNFVRPLRSGTLAQRLDVTALGLRVPRWVTAGVRVAQRARVAGLAGGAAGLALDLAAAVTGSAGARLATSCADEPPAPEELDGVWRSARGRIAASPVRDGSYLRSRYGTNGAGANESRYAFLTARAGGRLVGVAVLLQPRALSDPRLRGVRVATISDIVVPPERSDVGLALLAAVARAARSAGADAILATTGHAALASLLRRQGYVALAGNMHFFVRDATGAARWPPDLAGWWLARGDSGADEVF
jgi:hypothetical protein